MRVLPLDTNSYALLYTTLCVYPIRPRRTKQHDNNKHSSEHVMQLSGYQHLTIKLNCVVSVMSVQAGCQIHSAVVYVVYVLIGESYLMYIQLWL